MLWELQIIQQLVKLDGARLTQMEDLVAKF